VPRFTTISPDLAGRDLHLHFERQLKGSRLPRHSERFVGTVALDTETADQAWTATARLAERYRLTLYDAA
jgi:hypothetical protein